MRVPATLGTLPMNCLCLIPILWLAALSLFADDGLARRDWSVEGVGREALIHVPKRAATNALPLVFVFHGHGGSMNQAARSFHLHHLWPDALVVYPQGLKTPGRLTDPEGRRAGWQHAMGDQDDRDLKFFDAMLESLRTDYLVDAKRVYATGHSNGGGFTYLLWAARGDVLAAVAPSAAATSMKNFRQFKPKPVLHIAGRNDTLVKYEWQERTMEALRRLNQCGEGRPWQGEAWCTQYESGVNATVVTCIHPGAHRFPAEAPEIIVRFFK
jgi:polyhydroxybutyrate depolymerase